MELYEKIATAIWDSDKYQMIAIGWRNVSQSELLALLKIVCESTSQQIRKELDELYNHCPDTIALDKYMRESNCPDYCSQCDCYMPDISEPWCMRQRKAKLETNKKRYSIENSAWRQGVFSRDDYICQRCEQRGGKLNAHHIKSFKDYPKLRYKVSNGITLCVDCHKIEHGKLKKVKKEKKEKKTYSVSFDYANRTLTGLTSEDISEWKIAFPAVNIEQQIYSAKQWLIDNPAKKKKNVRRFLTNWLRRDQERGGGGAASSGGNGKTKLYPIKGKTCSERGCGMPAVYKKAGEYDWYYCSDHLPANVKKQYY